MADISQVKKFDFDGWDTSGWELRLEEALEITVERDSKTWVDIELRVDLAKARQVAKEIAREAVESFLSSSVAASLSVDGIVIRAMEMDDDETPVTIPWEATWLDDPQMIEVLKRWFDEHRRLQRQSSE